MNIELYNLFTYNIFKSNKFHYFQRLALSLLCAIQEKGEEDLLPSAQTINKILF